MLVTEMITQFDAHGFTDLSDAIKLQAINDAQEDFCYRYPWSFLETVATVPTVAGTSNIAMPTDWHATVSLYNTTTKNRLQYRRYEAVHTGENADITYRNEPMYFYLVAGVIHTYPVADAVYSLKHLYIGGPVAISTTGSTLTVPAKYHRTILTGAMAYLYEINDDDGKADRFSRRFEDRIVQAINDAQMRQYSDADTVGINSTVEYYSE